MKKIKGYLFRCVMYDEGIWKLLKKLGRKQGIFIEVALKEFLKTEKGQELFDLFSNEKEA